jgi:hypothetical protein
MVEKLRKSQVLFEWHRLFKEGLENVENDERRVIQGFRELKKMSKSAESGASR